MVKVKVTSVSVGDIWQEKSWWFLKRNRNQRWYALIELQLIDQDSQNEHRYIAEQFCLVVCSSSYKEKPNRKGPELDPKYTIATDKLDMDEVLAIAQSRVAEVEAKDWDEFFVEMEKRFLHVD